ncbi:MAG: CinA family protein [Anaerolineae bacterium]|nr:CinA family protein [Anaerolineae bacterium]
MKTLEEHVGDLLRVQRLTLASAESCTGGLIGHRLTNIAGSSDYYLGGIIAYSNQAKMQALNVQEKTLTTYGAVSEQVASEMARGARDALQSDMAVSVTGIAGPGGGTDEKPVGLTYIALATPELLLVRRFVWDGNRIMNKDASADAAFNMIIEYLS